MAVKGWVLSTFASEIAATFSERSVFLDVCKELRDVFCRNFHRLLFLCLGSVGFDDSKGVILVDALVAIGCCDFKLFKGVERLAYDIHIYIGSTNRIADRPEMERKPEVPASTRDEALFH